MTLKHFLQNPCTFCLIHNSNVFHWANWTITYLDKHILILHHQRIGVNVAREWFALVGICAVLQLAGDIQRLCSHTHKETHTHTHTRQVMASAMVLTNEERQPSPKAKRPLLACYITRVNKVLPVREELAGGGEDGWPERPIAFFAFNRSACPHMLASAKYMSAPSTSTWSIVMVSRLRDRNIWHDWCLLCVFVWLAFLYCVGLKESVLTERWHWYFEGLLKAKWRGKITVFIKC